MKNGNPVPGKDGNKYVPFEERTGESSVTHSLISTMTTLSLRLQRL